MKKRYTKKEIFSIPNCIGYFRILLIPVFCVMYLTAETQAEYLWAAALVLFSSATDLLDGWVARKFNQVTELGKFVDPLADKLTHAAVAVCLAIRYPLMWMLLALMAVKETYMIVKDLHFLKQGKKLDGAMWFGKVCTTVLFLGLCALLFFPEMAMGAVNTLIVLMMLVMVFTLCMYVPVFRRMEDEPAKEQ